jgi:signal transduction histidine kinase
VRSVADKPEAGWISIIVRDTGTGIPPENLSKIFDPFFTTKKEGKGTGLGLAVSYGLARQMGGRIEAASPAGGGAEMTVVLPRRAPTAPGEEEVGVVRRQGSKIIIG